MKPLAIPLPHTCSPSVQCLVVLALCCACTDYSSCLKPLPKPTCKLIPKHKWREDLPGSNLKVREVIEHDKQAYKSVCRHLGRCLTLLRKYACSRPGALECVSMEQLHEFVTCLSSATVSPSDAWVELDLAQMFPNVPRDKVLTTADFFWRRLSKDRQLSLNSSGFNIPKHGIRSLDSISAATKNDSCYQFFPIHDVLLLLTWDLMFNDRFVHFSSVFRQPVGRQ